MFHLLLAFFCPTTFPSMFGVIISLKDSSTTELSTPGRSSLSSWAKWSLNCIQVSSAPAGKTTFAWFTLLSFVLQGNGTWSKAAQRSPDSQQFDKRSQRWCSDQFRTPFGSGNTSPMIHSLNHEFKSAVCFFVIFILSVWFQTSLLQSSVVPLDHLDLPDKLWLDLFLRFFTYGIYVHYARVHERPYLAEWERVHTNGWSVWVCRPVYGELPGEALMQQLSLGVAPLPLSEFILHFIIQP